MAQHGRDDLDLVAEARWKQRTDGAVDQARDQNLVLRGSPFTLEEPTRNLAGGEGLLLIVDCERKEVLAGFCGFRTHGGAEHDRVAVAGQHSAIGLAGDFTRL